MPDRPSQRSPAPDQAIRQATDKGAFRNKAAMLDPAAAPLSADSEAAGTPTPAGIEQKEARARARSSQAAAPPPDRDQAVSMAQYPDIGEPRDHFLAAFGTCLALGAGVTAVFLVWALP